MHFSLPSRRVPQATSKQEASSNLHLSLPSRTPALDLAQQAQVAACNYLGCCPYEFSKSIYRSKGFQSESSRPLELHMHHHHHHYVATPTSPFSQSSSQFFEGPVNDTPVTTANELIIRAGSPVPATTTTNYAAPVEPPYSRGFQPQGSVQNPSQSLMHATSLGDFEATQRYLQNVLWLKNQIDDDLDQTLRHGQEQRGDKKFVNEQGLVEKELGSSKTGLLNPIPAEWQLPGYTRKGSCLRDDECAQNNVSSDDDVCVEKFRSMKAGGCPLVFGKYEKRKFFGGYHSPCYSPSEDNSITRDSTPDLSVAPSNGEWSTTIATNTRMMRMITNKNGETHGIPQTQAQISNSEDMLRSGGYTICSSLSTSREWDPKLNSRYSIICAEPVSGLKDYSVCSSGKLSQRKFTWNNSTCTESESLQKEMSLQVRPAKKPCGARASRQQASREARAWESKGWKAPKSNCHANARLDQRKEPVYVYEMNSGNKPEEKVADDKHSYMLGENLSLQDRYKEEKDSGDASRSKLQRSERQICEGGELDTSKTISATEHTEIAWIASLGTKRGLQHMLDHQDKSDAESLKLESMQAKQPCTSFSLRVDENTNSEYAAHNRLREAVEAAWKTSLGTYMTFKDQDDKKELADDKCGDSSNHKENLKARVFVEEDLDVTLKENTYTQVAAEEKVCLYEQAWKASLESKKGVEVDNFKHDPSDHVLGDILRDHKNLKTLVAQEETLQREMKDQTVAAEERVRVGTEQKVHIFEASAKAAEEGLCVVLDERASFHSKFKEELEQGATDRLRLQELLHLEKLKLEAIEGELREVRRSFQDSVAVGARTNKNLPQDPRLDILSEHSVAPHGIDTWHDEVHLKLKAESEGQMEAKAAYFEASAKVAEERLRSLLDETNWFYWRFKEELEHKSTDKIKLQQLMELEKANHEVAGPPRKTKLDVRSLVASSVANKSLDNNIEGNFQSIPGSLPPTKLPPSDWSVTILSGFETPLDEKDLTPSKTDSQGHFNDQQVTAGEIEPSLPDDPFEDLTAFRTQVTENGSMDYSLRKEDRLERCENCPSRGEPAVDNR